MKGGPANRPADFDLDLWLVFQPELGEGGFAKLFAELDLWPNLQPELGEGGFAKGPAEVDLGRRFNQSWVKGASANRTFG